MSGWLKTTGRRGLSLSLALGMVLVLSVGIVPRRAGVAVARQSDGCGDPATMIHDIQGTTDQTPEGGNVHTVEGVVIGDFQNTLTQFKGFFMQEEDADADSDPLTSEGIFVDSSLSRVDVNVGDVVRVTGTAFEMADSGANLTQIRRVSAITVCGSGASVTPTEVTLPVAKMSDWERWEGMLVTFPQELTVEELYNLGRYGEILMGVNGRTYQPTNVAAPGEPALAVEDDNALREILLDDGNNEQNIDPTILPPGGLTLSNVLRAGDSVTGVTGVLDQRFGVYRVQVTQPADFAPTNPRSAVPPDVPGRLHVASFNVLNYFNGDGLGGGFPTERGATTPEEFARQRAKIITAITTLDADVIGLIEIENDGDGPESAVADLVSGLNEAAGGDVYAYVPDPVGLMAPAPEGEVGGDAIKQAIVYKPAVVTPLGDPVTTTDAPFGGRRPPIAQAFEEVSTGEHFTVVVNHFKSKGCTGAGIDPDIGDGQGCWNQERVQAARTLLDWLATDPTGTGDPDVLVIGDLNSYAEEDPLVVFADAGYTNLVRQFGGAGDYTYIYMGLAGSLDHALGSPTLAPQAMGAAPWHINADESRVFDYNVEFKTENQIDAWYDTSPFRSSDHDPVLVGLTLAGGEGGTKQTDAIPARVKHDSSGGTLAIVVGLVAVVLAMVFGAITGRGKRR